MGHEVVDLDMFHRKLFQGERMLLQNVKIVNMSVSACDVLTVPPLPTEGSISLVRIHFL